MRLVVLLAIGTALVAGACSSSGGTKSDGSSSTPMLTLAKPDLTVHLRHDDAPQNPIVADGSVWVAAHHHDEVVRIDAATGKVTARTVTGKSPGGLIADRQRIWVVHYQVAGLVALDASSARIVQRVTLDGEGCCQPAVIDGIVWAASIVNGSPTLIGSDVSTGKLVRRVPGVDSPVAVGNELWGAREHKLARIDPRTGTVTELAMSDQLIQYASPPAQGLTWVWNPIGKALGLDTTGAVKRTVTGPGGAALGSTDGLVVTSGNTVWATDGSSIIWRIDRGASTATKFAQITPDLLSLAGDGTGGVWVSLFNTDTLLHFHG